MMPRQARKPCSGCGRRSGIRSQKGSGGWADRSGGAANAFKGPIGVAPVARRHVLGKGGVPVVAAASPMRGDPLTLEKDLNAEGTLADFGRAAEKLYKNVAGKLTCQDGLGFQRIWLQRQIGSELVAQFLWNCRTRSASKARLTRV